MKTRRVAIVIATRIVVTRSRDVPNRVITVCMSFSSVTGTLYPNKRSRSPCIWTLSSTFRRLVFALVGGQVLALLLCGTGSTSEALEQFYGISAPTSQLFFMYLLLSLVFGPVVICRKDFLSVLKENWWKYLILGIIDVEANYLVVLAYKYTNMASIQVSPAEAC